MPSQLSSEQLFGGATFKRTLRNGLTVLFAPEHNAGLVSVQAWVKTGSIHEGDLLGAGLSHYLEHLVFKGTQKYSCRGIAEAVQQAGATMNAYTTFDRTVYHIDGPAECAELAFDILAEMTLRPALTPEDAAREREVILREIDMRDDDPDSLLSEAVLAEAFHVHPYRLPVIGFRDAFAALTHAQVLAYHKARYAPANIVLVVAGALDDDTVSALADTYFGTAPASPVGAPNVPAEPEQLASRSGSLDSAVQVLRGCLAWRIPGMRHPDAPALDLFSMILGLGESSRLHQKLHDELGLVHDIDASNWAPGATGLLWLSYSADPGKRAEIEAAVLDVVETALNDGFFELEFAKARRACLMSFLENRKTVSGIAGQLALQSVIIGDTGYPSLYLERIENLTPNAVVEAARRHIRPDKLTTYAMEPRAANTAPAPTKTRDGQPPFEDLKLDNGLRILLQPVNGYPKINYRFMFPGGGANEPPNRRGVASLLATLLTRDTETRTATEVAAAAEALGASLQDTAGNNSFGISIETLTDDAAEGAALLADAVLHPALRERTFQIERDDQISAIREDDDDVVEFGHRRLRELFFGKHPLATNHLGHVRHLEEMSPSDIRALHARAVRPENAVLAVSGDFQRDELLANLREHFEGWHTESIPLPGSERRDRLESTPPAPFPERTGRVDETRPCEQALVFQAYPDTGITAADSVTGDLLIHLLSGMASQLFISIREERGMAYFVGANRVSSLSEGMFYLYAGTAPAHVDAVLAAMKDEVVRARAGNFSAGEIAAAKARLRTGRRMSAQSPGARTLNAALNALYALDVNRDAWWEKTLEAQNADTLGVFATKYLREDAALSYIVKPTV
jgi:zinc protease